MNVLSFVALIFFVGNVQANAVAELETSRLLSEFSALKSAAKLAAQNDMPEKSTHRVVKRSGGISSQEERNVTISTWQPWTACNVANCNLTGNQLRHRNCLLSGIASDDVDLCGTDLIERRPCRIDCVDGSERRSWSEWSTWNNCPVTCGYGKQMRRRSCEAGFCSGLAAESKPCHAAYACPEWSPWLEWSPCSETCGENGVTTRRKNCIQNRILTTDGEQSSEILKQIATNENFTKVIATDQCDENENSFQLEFCPGEPRCNFTWSEWTEWSTCLKSCGRGYQVSTRSCAIGDCTGDNLRLRPCNNSSCWTQWTGFSSCSRSCGKSRGYKVRHRRCIGEDYFMIRGCEGNNTERVLCEFKPCPMWSRWSRFGSCSSSCNGGKRTRTRRCLSGECRGASTDTIDCNRQPCPFWSEWSSYTCCSRTCGENGVQQRTRFCRFNYFSSVGCAGNSIQQRSCSRLPCNVSRPSVFDSFQCGKPQKRKSPEERILGGQETKENYWPWQASWQHRKCVNCDIWQHLCGATLVSPEWLVIAAHCTEEADYRVDHNNPGSSWSVVLGMHHLYVDGERHFLSRVFVHDEYIYEYVTEADIALLKLYQPVALSPRISPACLPELSRPEPEESCIITGWGNSEPPSRVGIRTSSVLLQVEIPIISFDTCVNIGPHYSEHLNETHHFCAGNPNNTSVDSCTGDSGGPMVCRRNNNQFYFFGITSFGFEECGTQGHVGVYTPVHSYEQWIRKTVENFSSNVC